MEQLGSILFEQYAGYSTLHIILESTAVFFGVVSVLYSRTNNILVFPTGIISTGIFVYLLNEWGLLGDMILNAYYFVMSLYGWWVWSRKVDDEHSTPITSAKQRDWLTVALIFVATLVCVSLIYVWRDRLAVESMQWIPYADIITTAIAFSGMWLMANRKIQHWLFWIVANLISVPLYFLKGYTLSSLQYAVFVGLAIWGWVEWNKLIKKEAKAIALASSVTA